MGNGRISTPIKVIGSLLATFCVVALVLFLLKAKPSASEEELESDYIAPPTAYKGGFQWQNQIPQLYRAAALPSDKAVRLLLQTSVDTRTYVAIQIQSACGQQGDAPQLDRCTAKLGDASLERAITKKIDEILAKRTVDRNHLTSADYALAEFPFPWASITVMKSDTAPFTLLSLEPPRDVPYLASEVVNRYGPPDKRTTDNDGYTLMTYEKTTDTYSAKAEFQVDPSREWVRRLTISLHRNT
jgi:hypothetical protein